MIGLLILSLASALEVEQVHVASGATVHSATIAWSTRFNCSDSQARLSLGSCHEASCFNSYFSGAAAELSTGNNTQFIHKVPVTVHPSTTYNYQVGCSAGWSKTFSLRTGKETGPNTFLVFGDLSTADLGKQSWEVMSSRLNTMSVDAIVHVGDISYDLFTDDNRHGDDYMNTLEPAISRIPYMVIAGNHETDDDYQSYNTRYAMPGNNFYHTYTIGLVRFVGINTESIVAQDNMTQPTLDFLQTTLNRTAEDKAAHPWLIVLGHRPLYCNKNNKTCQTQPVAMRKLLENMLYENGVDLYINGHVHNYQRTTAVYNNTPIETPSDVEKAYLNPDATIYITTGGPGNDEGLDPLTPNATLTWYVTGTDELTYSVMNVYNSTHLFWEQWFTQVDALADSFWVIKQAQDF
mmetsp:Transcript_32677/g.56807  ORF Transcript_32677/g.56807 Transcript_32677/m.56807 type:complete len:407 (+) Transcript_32677:139-1359(+)|eukprot:CAMPEP_0204915770 /NCGR_PEP_ID=MMETSP1397-20131031/13709_1 /ASSEMBLY_ACC=CAM_ASM_000891 /TAXON_ID=49980 /ORGANISM="Climacostomum Climacostomum virens, Strain Stock W-24" /LENGTH=406 /DNA_ID=CAMNT_0052087975 /DNA_START=114 /DNA_END=1334 /DNA_ORIENTATION=+